MAEQCLKQLEIDVKKEEQYSATQLEITQMLAGLQIRRCKSILLMDKWIQERAVMAQPINGLEDSESAPLWMSSTTNIWISHRAQHFPSDEQYSNHTALKFTLFWLQICDLKGLAIVKRIKGHKSIQNARELRSS